MSNIQSTQEATASFLQNNFSFVPADGLGLSKKAKELFGSFSRQWESLPRDPYLPAEYGLRYRRHGKFSYEAESQRIFAVEPVAYAQTLEDNSLAGGQLRRFAPLEPGVAGIEFLLELLEVNMSLLYLDKKKPWEINVHLIRIPAFDDLPGVPCPEGVHRDGFEAISIHLISKKGVTGGLSSLYSDSGTSVYSKKLDNVLDTIYVDDTSLMHCTTDISKTASCSSLGYRDTLLTSYSHKAKDDVLEQVWTQHVDCFRKCSPDASFLATCIVPARLEDIDAVFKNAFYEAYCLTSYDHAQRNSSIEFKKLFIVDAADTLEVESLRKHLSDFAKVAEENTNIEGRIILYDQCAIHPNDNASDIDFMIWGNELLASSMMKSTHMLTGVTLSTEIESIRAKERYFHHLYKSSSEINTFLKLRSRIS